MTSMLFEARLSDPLSASSTHFSSILFGADSLAQKEQRFRLMCQHKYPYHHIIEPIVTRPIELLSLGLIPDIKVS